MKQYFSLEVDLYSQVYPDVIIQRLQDGWTIIDKSKREDRIVCYIFNK